MTTGLAAPAVAQQSASDLPPVRSSIDGNGVDLMRGTIDLRTMPATAGQGDAGIAEGWRWYGGRWQPTGRIELVDSGSYVTVSIENRTYAFSKSGNVYISSTGDGSRLVKINNTMEFTHASGMNVVFTHYSSGQLYGQSRATKVIYADGSETLYEWDGAAFCEQQMDIESEVAYKRDRYIG